MADEISIDEEFETMINGLNDAVNNLNTDITNALEFKATTINPYVYDLDIVNETLEVIKKFQSVCLQDIATLHVSGQKIIEQDKELANRNYTNIMAP